jgi:hypothetical protein
MKKTILIDEDTARMIDDMRGELSRSEYVDSLLRNYQGVTLPHTPDIPMKPEPEK